MSIVLFIVSVIPSCTYMYIVHVYTCTCSAGTKVELHME